MSSTSRVNFNDFIKNNISLDPAVTEVARSSRDFLYSQLKALPSKAENFPRLYPEKEIFNYGSFSRKTKIRLLDDIDFMLIFAADGATYNDVLGQVKISIPEEAKNLFNLLGTDGFLSSKKVANKIKNNISKVSQYRNAEIRSNQEAVILNLSSYHWSFDIIPAFITSEETDGRSYYLIPDGNGHWKKTDPRIDKERTTNVNKDRDLNVLEFIRIIKYWNKIQNLNISSYLMENLVLKYVETHNTSSSRKHELSNFFTHLTEAIYYQVADPKGIQGDLNTLDVSKRQSVSNKASQSAKAIRSALEFEGISEYALADKQWRIVFGDSYE